MQFLPPQPIHSMAARNGDVPYSDEVFERICAGIASGESLVTVCKQRGMPHRASVLRWIASIPEARDRYTRAREDQADTLADQIVDIADKATDANKGRLQVDARKWVAAKLKPKKYGESLDHRHSGTLNVTISSEDLKL